MKSPLRRLQNISKMVFPSDSHDLLYFAGLNSNNSLINFPVFSAVRDLFSPSPGAEFRLFLLF